MTDGGIDRRDQLIMWAMAEASLLRRQEKQAAAMTARSESAWVPPGADSGDQATLGGQGADCGGLVVDWQLPEGLGPETAA